MSGDFEGLSTATVNGARLAFRETGTGAPVVLIHGSGSDLRIWEHQIEPLGARARVFAYSRRYARPNDDIAPDADDQMLPHVEDLAAFLSALDIPAAHLVGHSWGGFIALLTAIRHLDIVRSLVLIEPPVLSLFISTPPRPAELLRLLLRDPGMAAAIVRFGATVISPAQKAYRRGDDEAAIRAFGEGVLGKAAFASLSPEDLRRIHDNGAASRAQIIGAGFPPLSEAEVRGVRTPTLLIRGAESPRLFRRLSAHLRALLPSTRLVDIPGASHIVQRDNPAAFNAAVLDFLETASPPDHS